MEYIAVLNNYLEYSLDEKTWYGFHLSSFFESYWRKRRLKFLIVLMTVFSPVPSFL